MVWKYSILRVITGRILTEPGVGALAKKLEAAMRRAREVGGTVASIGTGLSRAYDSVAANRSPADKASWST